MRGGAYYWLALASSGARSSCGGEERGDDSIEVLKWDWSGEGADLVRRRASTTAGSGFSLYVPLATGQIILAAFYSILSKIPVEQYCIVLYH